jgi:hypothetical protein
MNLGFSTFGYADDIVIIFQGKFAHTVKEVMQNSLNVVAKWAVREGLNISPHKAAKYEENREPRTYKTPW